MNNQISNPKVEVPKGKDLNDKDYINILLCSLKDIEKNYTVALTEASNEYLYNEYKNMFEQFSKLQREVFELAFKKGWYILEKADTNKINQKFNMLNQEVTTLNN